MPVPRQGEGCCGGACVCCPYGCYYTAPIIFAVIAMALTNSAYWSCNWYKSWFSNYDIFTSDQQSSFRIGPMFVENFNVTNGVITDKDDTCVYWSDHDELGTGDIDAPLKAARVILTLTWCFALIFFVTFCFGACMILEKTLLNCLAFGFITFGVLFPLGLVSLASKWCEDADKCEWRAASVIALLVFFLWVAAGVAVMTIQEPEKTLATPPPAAAPAAGAVEMTGGTTNTVEQTIVEEDGTVVKLTTKTSTAPDGTKTVTETREVIQPGGTGKGAVATSAAATVEEEEIPVAAAKPVSY